MAYDPNDLETKAAIKAAAEAAAAEAVEGLKAKNTELLGKLKKAQKDATIDPADHAAIQTELAETQTKLAEANKELKAARVDSDKIKKQYETESKVAHNLLVDTGLSNALLAAGVKSASSLKAEGDAGPPGRIDGRRGQPGCQGRRKAPGRLRQRVGNIR